MKINLKYDWQDFEGRRLLRFKNNFFSEYIRLQREGLTEETSSSINEESLNLIMLAAYRKGLEEGKCNNTSRLKDVLMELSERLALEADYLE